ncbi:MAG: DivIVA domain-containing protein [Gemmatimonadales bacterium]|nr:MAG: DivIVA domain-containing protein [Gemmatimonadales bacterium]
MIDLTPLDVRKKKDDFRRTIRGYDPAQVDAFLDLCAERLDELVHQGSSQQDEAAAMTQRLGSYEEREHALNEALVMAQELREQARAQADKSAELTLREAEQEAAGIRRDAETAAHSSRRTLDELRVRRAGFLRSMRWSLERFLGEIEEEERRLATEEAGSPAAHEVAEA